MLRLGFGGATARYGAACTEGRREFLSLLAALYLRCFPPELPSSLSGFEAVLLTVYSSEAKNRHGKPVLVQVPNLAVPSLHHTPASSPSSTSTRRYGEEWLPSQAEQRERRPWVPDLSVPSLHHTPASSPSSKSTRRYGEEWLPGQAEQRERRPWKFSPDGQFLASGGEDGIVRVCGVTQFEDCKIPIDDPSCVYLKAHRQSGLAPIDSDNGEKCTVEGVKQYADSACVVIPTMVFQISEEPLHEFRGHSGDVLNLSWSNNKHLLSALTDKTVRLWEIGSANCITVFPHSNFVTCVQFNPGASPPAEI